MRRRVVLAAAAALLVSGVVVAVAVSAGSQRGRVHVSPSTAPPSAVHPATGSVIGSLAIPLLDLDVPVLEGTTRDVLRRGVGHDPATPLPDRRGTVVIVGHRTTYGAPFQRLDELHTGDSVIFSMPTGSYRYVVAASRVVDPSMVDALLVRERPALALVTNTPKYSARLRLVVTAQPAAA